MIAQEMVSSKPRRRWTSGINVQLESVCKFEPRRPADAGVLRIDGRVYTYIPSTVGWTLLDSESGTLHHIRGRLVLVGCSCGNYYAPRGNQTGDCVHMLALLRCQQAVSIPFLRSTEEYPLSFSENTKSEGSR